jgi:ketol-acid reductoisomerase
MAANFYYDKDAHLDCLSDRSIGLIGYGNQGQAHALNLRDSGLSVWVGSRENSAARERADADGFKVHTIGEVVQNCDVLSIMLPDDAIPSVYKEHIEPCLKPRATFVFAHGFVIRHKTIRLGDSVDVVLIAPTGPGRQLRSLYEAGRGLPALVAVDQDVSGDAWKRCLAYARGIGCTRAGVVKTTFEEETVTDLFCEQAVLCGGIPELIKAAFDTLVQKGYQPELAYISCLKEVKLIADLLFTSGIDGMREAISTTAKYGSAIAGPQVITPATREAMERILSDIENRKFAQDFLADARDGSPTINNILSDEKNSQLARIGKELQDALDFS